MAFYSSKFFKYWFPVIGYSAIIFFVSSLSDLKTPGVFLISDKICHVGEYFIFGWLLSRALMSTGKRGVTVFILVLFGTFLYGLSDEYHQSFVIGRTSSFLDVLADLVGGTIGGFFYPRLVKQV